MYSSIIGGKEDSYDKSNYQEDRFHMAEKIPLGKHGSGPVYIVVDKATGYECVVRIIGGAVLGEDK